MNAGAWVEAGITQPVFIMIGVGTTCTANVTLGQDIVNAVVGDGSTSATAGTDAAGNAVAACLASGPFYQTNVGPNGSVTP